MTSTPRHNTPLLPKATTIDINYLLDHYSERVAARTGPRPGLPVHNEMGLGDVARPRLNSSGGFYGRSPVAERFLVQRNNDAGSPIPPNRIPTPKLDVEPPKPHEDGNADQFREEIASFVLSKPYTVSIFGAGYYGGQPITGVEQGPDVLREAGLAAALYNLGWEVVDQGNVVPDERHTNETDPTIENVNAPLRVSDGCRQTFEAARKAVRAGHVALTLGGDHSLAMGSIAGVASQYSSVGVIWVDAHADLNTPMISPSGNLHGMPMGFLLGLVEAEVPGLEWFKPCLSPDRVVYIGLRDVDFVEKKLLKRLGIKAFSMHHVDKFGIGRVMEKALKHLAPLRHRPIHLSFDVDAIDPAICPATGTPVMGGLTFREAAYICEAVAETGLLVGLDIVEVNPDLGNELEREQTVQVALGLVKSALGHELV